MKTKLFIYVLELYQYRVLNRIHRIMKIHYNMNNEYGAYSVGGIIYKHVELKWLRKISGVD